MINSTQEIFMPSEKTIIMLRNVARQYASLRKSAVDDLSISPYPIKGMA